MTAPTATLLLSTHCPHCPSVLQSLSDLLKKGDLSQLHVVNIEADPDVAQQLGVRSVPWIKIADYVLTGLQPMDALKQRIEWANKQDNLLGEFDHMLSHGDAQKVIDSINADNQHFDVIMKLLEDPATILSTRIGIGVIMEEFEGTQILKSYLNKLIELLDSKDNRVRADAAHYLSLTHSSEAIPHLESHKNTEDQELREVIEDSLEVLLS